MKRKSRLIVSIVSLIFSVTLMMFGVYASSNPQITISGYVTFNVSASQVSVTGTIIDGYDANGTAIPFVSGSSYHYQDYTNREKTTLSDWVINGGNSIYFKEDSSGVTDIKLKFDFTNNSPFYTVAKFENVVASNNVNVTFDQQVVMDLNGNEEASKSSTITYSVIDDSKSASSDINFTITFERYLANGQDFQTFQNNIDSQIPLTVEQVTSIQNDLDKKKSVQNVDSNNNQFDNQTISNLNTTNADYTQKQEDNRNLQTINNVSETINNRLETNNTQSDIINKQSENTSNNTILNENIDKNQNLQTLEYYHQENQQTPSDKDEKLKDNLQIIKKLRNADNAKNRPDFDAMKKTSTPEKKIDSQNLQNNFQN